MASPHPSLPLLKYFFFPGFSTSSGGLLKEASLIERRDAWQAGLPPHHGIEVSLFCYESAAVGELLDLLATSPLPVRCHVPPGKPLAAVTAYLGGPGPWQIGHLTVAAIPFLAQDEYDRLLWGCDINFVRGEDSFVRALWAGRPLVWQIYEQDEQAHMVKLAAFLDCYTKGIPAELATTISSMFVAWNTGQNLNKTWAQFVARRKEIGVHSQKWSRSLAENPDLAASLVKFCGNRL